MTEKLSERLHKAVLDAYAEAQVSEGSSRLLSELQGLIDDEVASLEQQVAAWREAYLAHKAYKANNNGENARRNRAATDKLKELKLK